MQSSNNKIIEILEEVPKGKVSGFGGVAVELEKFFRKDSDIFRTLLLEAREELPDSPLLEGWYARLYFKDDESDASLNELGQTKMGKLGFVIGASLLALALVKLPEYTSISNSWFSPRFVHFIVIISLIAYFFNPQKTSLKNKITMAVGVALAAMAMMFYPGNWESDSVTMSQIHLPMLLLSVLGLSFMADEWKSTDARIRFIRYGGELVIFTSIVLLGGMVLTGITLGLFNLIGLNIGNWYMEYVVLWGLLAAPLVGSYIFDVVLKRKSKLASLVATIFAPLFLITVVAYLLGMLYAQKSPFSERDFLITVNGLLVVVWGIAVFSIAGEKAFFSKFSDAVNVGLVAMTLLVNMVALSAILFRLTEYGMTPNRVAVTGANILIFTHLILIFKEYIQQWRGESSPSRLQGVIAGYLPVYSAWSVVVVVLLPVLFAFQ